MALKTYLGWTTKLLKAYADLETRFSSYNTKAEGFAGDGVIDDRALLNTLVNVTMQPNGGQLDVVGTPRIATNVSIPANVSIKYMAGAAFVPDAGVAITILGKVIDLGVGGAGSPEGVLAASGGRLYGQIDAVLKGLQWVKKKGADAFGWAPNDSPLLVPALTTGTGSITPFGDSFTTGQGAAPATESYVNIIAAALGGAVTNVAVAGTGVYTAIAQFYVQVASWTPRHPVATLVTWMAGFNDIRRNGAAVKTIAKIKNCLRAFIAVSFSNTNIAASDAAVTKVGAWVNFTPAGGQVRATSLAGNALSGLLGMTISWPFVGDSLVIGTFVSDGVTYLHGPATITVDGVLVLTYDPDLGTDNIADSAYDNGRVPGAIVLRGLGSGAHTVVIAPTHAVKPFIVDYLSTLVLPGDAMPLLVAVPPRMNAAGYAIAPNLGTDAGMAAAASAIMDVVGEWPDYPVRSVWPNSQYDLATGVSGDNIHPNNLGHYQIAKAFLYAIQTALTPVFRGASANSTKVGRVAVAGAASATAVGDNAQALAANSTALGTNASSANGGVAVGSSASAGGVNAAAIGTLAAAPATDSTAVGAGAAVVGAGSASSTAVGSGASASSTNDTVVGKGANSNSDRGTAVGAVAAATAVSATAVGSNTVAAHASATALGKGATTTTPNQMRMGTATEFVSEPGGLAWSHRATVVAAGTTLGITDHVVPCDATGGAFAITLPDATLAAHLDRTYVIKKIDVSANAVTIQTTGGQTIDGAATKVLAAQWNFVRVMSNGANWLIVG